MNVDLLQTLLEIMNSILLRTIYNIVDIKPVMCYENRVLHQNHMMCCVEKKHSLKRDGSMNLATL